MLDIKFIREHRDEVKAGLRKRGLDSHLVDELFEADEQWRIFHTETNGLRAGLNVLSERIGNEKSRGDPNKVVEQAEREARKLKTHIARQEILDEQARGKAEELIYRIPNLPFDDVPVGPDESANKVIRTWGEIPKFSFEPKDHVTLGEALDIIDIERAARVSGTRFGYFKREAVLLEFALIQYTFDLLTSSEKLQEIAEVIARGYPSTPFIPVVPPVMIRPEVFAKMARLSAEDKGERYYIPSDDLYLAGSAEHTIGPLHMDEVLNEATLPLRYVGFSTSFRREAGSYGKDTRGVLRVHQFDKIELESFSTPETSLNEQEFFVAVQENLLQGLGIPYQVVMISSGEMGKPDARQIDIECWLSGQGRYRETHTADLMTDYQARRLNTKVRRKDGRTEFVHMNDATAFAIGRTLIAILENYQQEDGSVKIPEALQTYMHGIKEIRR